MIEPLRHIYNKEFGAVIFRATYPQIMLKGGLWDESENLYPLAGGRPRVSDVEWSFPSGATIKFAHMGSEKDKLNYQGAQIPMIGWDQLEHFSESQFFYMLSRNRSMSGVRPYMRCTCNPDAESWIADLVSWWIDPETGFPILSRSGIVRWFVRDENEELVWADSREELVDKFGDPDRPKSLTFIPATVYDNQKLLKADPGYLANLKALPKIDRERLLGGNWKVKAEAGKVFNRSWFEIVDAAPSIGQNSKGDPVPAQEALFWDFAATIVKTRGDDPDYTAGVKMRLVNGVYYVMMCEAEQAGPAEVDRMFVNLSKQGQTEAARIGAQYQVRWEVEPGSAGIRESRRLAQMLTGLICKGVPSMGDKVTRAKAFASQAEAGNVKLVRGDWNHEWLTQLHHFPDWAHDDIVDASTGAFNTLNVNALKLPAPRSYQG